MKQNLKPFDLEAALNGAAVVTREGKEVTEVVVLKNTFYGKNVLALINNGLYSFKQDGKVEEDAEHFNDLFMKPQQVTKWVNIYALASGNFTTGEMFDTQDQAINEYSLFGEPLKTIQITFEA
jgi:hypothetical protein